MPRYRISEAVEKIFKDCPPIAEQLRKYGMDKGVIGETAVGRGLRVRWRRKKKERELANDGNIL